MVCWPASFVRAGGSSWQHNSRPTEGVHFIKWGNLLVGGLQAVGAPPHLAPMSSSRWGRVGGRPGRALSGEGTPPSIGKEERKSRVREGGGEGGCALRPAALGNCRGEVDGCLPHGQIKRHCQSPSPLQSDAGGGGGCVTRVTRRRSCRTEKVVLCRPCGSEQSRRCTLEKAGDGDGAQPRTPPCCGHECREHS